MKIPRLKMRKTTRGTLAGVMIAIGSLYALTVSYDIPRSTLVSILLGSVLLVAAMMIAAVGLVLVFRLLALVWRKLRGRQDEDS